MSNCNTCGSPISWGYDASTGRWIPLEPVATHDDLDRTHVDENGELRAEHRQRHDGPSVNVQRLRRKISPLEAQAQQAEQKKKARNERARQRRAAG